ncbi:biotin transport system substrate-specific component [Eubacterium uniforme]|uniref:Biotin transporter n=2 Tax=Eubacterium uniforme TaxID=39495 RepID=A0A1T4V8P9_9FIRM|nr:biotin transport system substrate-specific component [Eubacterium uniforme]
METTMDNEKRLLTTREMTLIAMFAAVITVCSFIRIPLGSIPFTMQTFAVFTVIGILGIKRGVITVVLYELLGLVGLPVFGGKGGLSVITGPTGGYITGFILSVLIAGSIIKYVNVNGIWFKRIVMFIALLLGDAACFIIGTFQFMQVSGNTLNTSMKFCVTPFIIPDIVKMILAIVIIERIKPFTDNIFSK